MGTTMVVHLSDLLPSSCWSRFRERMVVLLGTTMVIQFSDLHSSCCCSRLRERVVVSFSDLHSTTCCSSLGNGWSFPWERVVIPLSDLSQQRTGGRSLAEIFFSSLTWLGFYFFMLGSKICAKPAKTWPNTCYPRKECKSNKKKYI